MPKKTVRVNNQDQQQDDPERAIRVEGDVIVLAEVADAMAPIRTPVDAPGTTFDVAIVAELLGPDDKTPVFTTHSAARRLAVDVPFKITITGPTTLEAKAGAGEAGKLAGTIVRSPGFDGPVRLTLGNVPPNMKPNAMIVRPGQNEFAFPVSFVYGSPTGELKDVQVLTSADVTRSGVGSPLPTRLNLNVTAGEVPKAEPPLELYEDDAEITAQVPDGGGQIAVEAGDKLTGARSLRVTPPQRYAAKIERLGLPIRENPGPGEYRYIRFAWKKKGGAKLCLQIGHDNTFGPAGDKTFRYTASDADCGGPALKISEKLPTEQFEIVTRDLFADFGAFTLTSFAFAPLDGEHALFDHIYLGRYAGDFELIPLEPKK